MRYEIEFTRLQHREGTKEYAIDFIKREDGAVLLIFQWGARGTKGQLQSHFFKPSEKKRAVAKREKKIQNKKARGYINDANCLRGSSSIIDSQELQQLYKGSPDDWWNRIPENHRKLITGDILENPDLQELVALQSETTNIDMAATYANHPLYGRF